MVLNISSLLSGEKNKLDIDYMLAVSTAEMGNAVNLSGVSFPSPAKVSGYITDNAGYMRLSLSVTLPYQTLCARCARDVSGEFEIDFERTVVPEGMVDDAEEKEEDFVVVENGMLDIDEQLSEILLLDFPTRVLCKEDCKGLCQKCGKDLNEGPCNCPTKELNPAFAKILSMFDEE
ncbi:MAG: DUF177 domain-containing protein [Clostridia bacterium]|nr:DUF177 domain-containing protein [Clostridia bacterium]